MIKKIVRLASNEIWPLLNVLNEVCNGIYIPNFEHSLCVKMEKVVELLNKISEDYDNKEYNLRLSQTELNILNKSLEEVFRAIDPEEFQTRIGISIREMEQIKEKLRL